MRAFGAHAASSPVIAGVPAHQAAGALILVHGRGGTAEGMLDLANELGRRDLFVAAPRAAGRTWYPRSFLAPIEQNEPGLSSGLSVLEALVAEVEQAGVPHERQILLGFSQGACLTLEFAARNPRRYGGIVGLTGGLVGPPDTSRDYSGSLDGTPIFLGSSAPDPHVPWSRVNETAEVLEHMGAEVDLRRYPGMDHTINDEEVDIVRSIIDAVAESRDRQVSAVAGS